MYNECNYCFIKYGTLQKCNILIVIMKLLQNFVVLLQYVCSTTSATENYNAYYAQLQCILRKTTYSNTTVHSVEQIEAVHTVQL